MAAFRAGFGELVSLDGGALAFEPLELRELLCGPDEVTWDEASLRTSLHPVGDFKLPRGAGGGTGGGGGGTGGGEKEERDTLVWLRRWLVSLGQPDRLRFVELATGQALLPPGRAVTVRRTDAKLPFFHGCTSTLDLPLFASEAALVEAMATALANMHAGGFYE